MSVGSDSIHAVEVAPRDGLQNEKILLPTPDKVSLILRAAAAGARRIEAVSFVSPTRVPQMADAAAVMSALRSEHDLRAQGVSLIGLVLNRRGFDRSLAAGVDEVNFVVVASETFNHRNQGVSIAQTMVQIADTAAVAKSEGIPFTVTIAAAFGCPFEGEVVEGQVTALAVQAVAMGATELALADTIGVADPLAVERRLGLVRAAAPNVTLRVHFHNTRNTGIANAYAAWRVGVTVFDAAIGGIGGCPFAPTATGNIATEDMAYMFERMGVRSGLDLQSVIETGRWVGERLGYAALPGMVGRAGVFPPVH